ncbi:MAG: Spy/CpxP family protein refolding chaperone [Bacteroidales bacterium]
MKKIVLISLAITLSVLMSAQGKMDNRKMNNPRHQNRECFQEALNLSVDQQKNIASIRIESRNETKVTRNEMKTIREEVRKEQRSNNPNIKIIETNLNKMTDLKVILIKNKISTRNDIMTILTPDQRKKFIELKEERLKQCGTNMKMNNRKNSNFKGIKAERRGNNDSRNHRFNNNMDL